MPEAIAECRGNTEEGQLSRIIKEGDTEEAMFELGLKGWTEVWDAKKSNHFELLVNFHAFVQ